MRFFVSHNFMIHKMYELEESGTHIQTDIENTAVATNVIIQSKNVRIVNTYYN